MHLLRPQQIQAAEVLRQQPELGHRKAVAAGQRCRVGRVVDEGRAHGGNARAAGPGGCHAPARGLAAIRGGGLGRSGSRCAACRL
jgi:hypothetical protein